MDFNYGFQQPQQQFQVPLMNNNYGGYPIGYPPSVPTFQQPNPYVSPYAQPQPFNPGVTTPLEIQFKDGSAVTVPPTAAYTQGGARVVNGGYNPINGAITNPVAGQGFNPFSTFVGNPGYGGPGQGTYIPTPMQQGQQPMYNNYQSFQPYYPYGQNAFDYELQEYLYNQEPSMFDTKAMLEDIILTDEEREKINHNKSMYQFDYFGRPIMNAYQYNQQVQTDFEQARESYQKYYTMLSRIAHAYSGEKINEEAVMRRFDPVPPQPKPTAGYSMFYNPNMTDKEKEIYEANKMLQNTEILAESIARYDYMNAQVEQRKEYMRAQVKASHDRLIGVNPGEHYDLKTFLDNGYKLAIDIAMKQAKAANRNGTNKYSRNEFRANLSQSTNQVIPVTSKSDEYVSIEQTLKKIYDRNKMDGIMRQNNGQTVYTSAGVFPSEYDAHMHFLEAMQGKKEQNDIQRAVM